MKHLSEYLKESIRDLQIQNYRYEFLNNHFNGDVPDCIEEKFYAGNYMNDYVFEFLKSQENGTFNILIEPIYPEIANDKIKLHYGKYVYHVTSKENYESIKRTGLRTKTNFANRKYDPRIYFIATDNDVKSKIKSVIDSVYDGDEYKCVILKIELPVKGINVYKDESRKDSYSYFTYTTIPASLIKAVKLDKI